MKNIWRFFRYTRTGNEVVKDSNDNFSEFELYLLASVSSSLLSSNFQFSALATIFDFISSSNYKFQDNSLSILLLIFWSFLISKNAMYVWEGGSDRT